MEHLNALPAGTRLGEYEIEGMLGEGGFGITYRTYDANLNKVVAIKEYLPRDIATRTNTRTVVPTSRADQADYEWGLERFLDEARTLARFNHPHLNKVQRYFEAHGTAYLVLEYVEGETLSAVLQRQGTLSQAHIERLLSEVLSGLEEVHAAGYIHRDLKPSNLMVQPDGSVVVLDFGAARQAVGQRSRSVTSILTPGYAPIEQYATKAEKIGPWSDLYALGMVAYQCVSGLRGTELPDAVSRRMAQDDGEVSPKAAVEVGQGRYDRQLLAAIDWAIEVQEDARPRSIVAWRQALPTLAPSQGQAIPQPNPPVPPDARPALPRWATVAGIVALIVAVGAGAYWLGQRMSGGPPQQVAVPPPAVQESQQVTSPAPQGTVSAPPTEEETVVSPAPVVQEPSAPAPPDPAAIEAALGLGREERIVIQRGLRALEYAPGPADGAFGPSTRQALTQWQTAKGYAATGYLEREQVDALLDVGRDMVPMGAFVVETEPVGATVELLGIEERYRSGLELPVGRYQVEVRAAGYEAQRVWVDHTASGEPHQVALAAERQPFTIIAEPAAARIRLVNIPERYEAGIALPAGAYQVEVSVAGYQTVTETVVHGAAPTERRIALARASRQPGERFRDCPTCPELVVVPAGWYRMGSPSHEENRSDDEGPVHRVTIAQPFAVGVYEVTVGEWDACVSGGGCNGYRPDDAGWGRGRRPVINVSWDDAQAYVRWLSRQTGQSYRLLSEAEWEYVARAGTTTPFHFGRTISPAQANYDGNYTYGGGRQGQYRERTVPVGSFRPNAFGLYDVHGNVWEWVQDCWNGSYAGAPSDGRVWETGDCRRRVLRGGSSDNNARNLRSAYRYRNTADNRNNDNGFRITRSLP